MSRKPFIEELKPLVKNADCDVCLCVPAILIPAMVKAAEGSNIHIGAENVHWAASGAYTGEISTGMLKYRTQRKTSVFRRDGRKRKQTHSCSA